VKPVTSRPTSNERYIICFLMRPLSNENRLELVETVRRIGLCGLTAPSVGCVESPGEVAVSSDGDMVGFDRTADRVIEMCAWLRSVGCVRNQPERLVKEAICYLWAENNYHLKVQVRGDHVSWFCDMTSLVEIIQYVTTIPLLIFYIFPV
jgi:hypothetical protein